MKKVIFILIVALSAAIGAHAQATDNGTAISLWGEVTTNLSIHKFVHDQRIIEVDLVTNTDDQEGVRVVLFDKDTMIQKTMEKDPTMKLQLMCTPLDAMEVQNYKAEMGEEFLGQCMTDGYFVGYNARIVPLSTPLPTGQKKISSSDYPKLKFFKYDICDISAVIKFEKLVEAPGVSQVLAPLVENRKVTDHARYALIYGKDTMYTAFTEKDQDDHAIIRALPISNAEIMSYAILASKAKRGDERKEAQRLYQYMLCLQTGMLPGIDPKLAKPRYRIFSWDVRKATVVSSVQTSTGSTQLNQTQVQDVSQGSGNGNLNDVPPPPKDTVAVQPNVDANATQSNVNSGNGTQNASGNTGNNTSATTGTNSQQTTTSTSSHHPATTGSSATTTQPSTSTSQSTQGSHHPH